MSDSGARKFARADSPVSLSKISGARELIGVEVLVVDGDPSVRQGLTNLLAESSIHVTGVAEGNAAAQLLGKAFFSVALIDVDTPFPGEGIATIEAVHRQSPTTMIIAMTPRRSFEDATLAVRAGAIDIVVKSQESVPYLNERVLSAAGRSVGKREVDSVLGDIKNSQEEFLQRFMDAERRATEATDKAAGRDSNRSVDLERMDMLIVDEADSLVESLQSMAPANVVFVHATSGGEALDRISSTPYHYALIAEDMSDLPATTIVRTIKTQRPDTVVLTFRGPGENGYVKLIETNGSRIVVDKFLEASQLIGRLDDLSVAWRAKNKERRYTQAFREKHYDFLRRFVELRAKIDKALREG
jgi:DNA-binding NtrC family response regulator